MRLALFTLLTTFSLYGVEVNVMPDSNLSISQAEMAVVKKAYVGTQMVVNDEKLRLYLSDNRKLSDLYIKNVGLKGDEAITFRHTVERILAKKMIEKIQDETELTEDVIKSYYIAHKDEFKSEDRFDYYYLVFDDFRSAAEFYLEHNSSVEAILDIAKKEKITVVPFKGVPKSRAPFHLVQAFYKEVKPIILPPQHGRKYEIIYGVTKHAPEALPYQQVRSKIHDKLFDEAYKDKKDAYMLSLEQKGE